MTALGLLFSISIPPKPDVVGRCTAGPLCPENRLRGPIVPDLERPAQKLAREESETRPRHAVLPGWSRVFLAGLERSTRPAMRFFTVSTSTIEPVDGSLVLSKGVG
jgi:hypothetical protein